MLLHIPAVLSPEQIATLRAALDTADWADGRETVGAQGAKVKRNRQLPDGSPLRRQLGRVVLDALAKHPLYHAAALPLRTLAPRFNRYEGGGEYGFHVDGAVMALDGEGAQIRSDVSCTLFLNDPHEYDAGDLIVYPSSSLHRVTPVTRGARIASFFWVQSLIRDDSRRRLLFELDGSIQALTASGADATTVLQLTGIYHNLLRQWAET
jgi:PKHD-type hydroxylase